MCRTKLVLLGLLAVLTASAVGSSPALAFSFLIEGRALTGSETKTTTSAGSPAIIEFTGIKTECAESEGEDTLEAAGKGKYHTVLKTCIVVKPSGCLVGELILFKGPSQLSLVAPGVLAELFLPSTGQTLTTLTYSDKTGESCAIAGTQEVTGVLGALVGGGEAEKEIGELEFTSVSSGTHLELAGIPGKFRLKEKVKLSGTGKGEKWGAMML